MGGYTQQLVLKCNRIVLKLDEAQILQSHVVVEVKHHLRRGQTILAMRRSAHDREKPFGLNARELLRRFDGRALLRLAERDVGDADVSLQLRIVAKHHLDAVRLKLLDVRDHPEHFLGGRVDRAEIPRDECKKYQRKHDASQRGEKCRKLLGNDHNNLPP